MGSCIDLCYNATYSTTTTIDSLLLNCSVGSHYLLMGANYIDAVNILNLAAIGRTT
jgi:hypothetical protein